MGKIRVKSPETDKIYEVGLLVGTDNYALDKMYIDLSHAALITRKQFLDIITALRHTTSSTIKVHPYLNKDLHISDLAYARSKGWKVVSS